MELIIKDIRQSILNNYPKVALKINKKLKEMGFQEAYFVRESKNVGSDTYFPKLTFLMNPRYTTINTRANLITDELKEKLQSIENSYISEYYISEYNFLLNHTRLQEEYKTIEILGSVIGIYLPNRNIVILSYPILNYLEMGSKMWVFFMDELAKWISENDVREVDNREILRKRALEFFKEDIRRVTNNLNVELQTHHREVNSYQESLIGAYNFIRQKTEQIKANKIILNGIDEEIEKKIEEIKNLSFVTRVNLSGRGIRIDFKEVFINYNGEKINMGSYFAYITPKVVTIENKEPVVFNGETYHHPHIKDSSICFGDGKEKIYQLLGDLKLKESVYFLYLFLKGYNGGDCYLSMSNWIRCKENGGSYDSSCEANEEDDEEYE